MTITFAALQFAVDTAQQPIRRSDLEREIGLSFPKEDNKLIVTQLLSEEILVRQPGGLFQSDYTSEAAHDTLQAIADTSADRPRAPSTSPDPPAARRPPPPATLMDGDGKHPPVAPRDWWPDIAEALGRRQMTVETLSSQLGRTKDEREAIRDMVRQAVHRGDLLKKSSGKLVPRELPDPAVEPPDITNGQHLRKLVQMLAALPEADLAKAVRLAERLREQRRVVAQAQADERAILAEAEAEEGA